MWVVYCNCNIQSISSNLWSFYFESPYTLGLLDMVSRGLHQIEPITKMVVSHDGRNLPDFLASLDDNLVAEFSEWLNSLLLKLELQLKRQNGLAGIKVINSGGRKVHIADSGFGISEFLPYLAQIWFESQRIQDLPTVSKSSGRWSIS